jgi:peptide/nickel transport system substrate-binding protein
MKGSRAGLRCGILLSFVVAVVLTIWTGTGAQQPATDTTTITWGEDTVLSTLDPRFCNRHCAQVTMHVFDSLVFRDYDGKFYPWLATRWQFSNDGKSITFQLRRDVQFHDGTPFDASAVKFTLDNIVDPKTASTSGAVDLIGPYDSTEVVDRYTVKVNWKQPFAPALLNLSSQWNFAILPPKAVQELGREFALRPVGTGPFKVVEWVPRVRVVLESNPNYNWAPRAFKHQGPPFIKRLVFRIIPDATTRVAALERGEIDVADQVPPIDAARFKGSRDINVMEGDVSGTPMMYLLNTTKGPTDDMRIRQALLYAVDRSALVRQVFFGISKPAYGPIVSTTPGYWPGVEKMYPYDPGKAHQLLEGAGWKIGSGGMRFKNGQLLEIYFPVSLVDLGFAEAVQAVVKQVGIKLNIERMDFARQNELIVKNSYNIVDLRWPAQDPSVMRIMWFSRNIPTATKYAYNWARFASPELDNLLETADANVDSRRRARLLEGVQKIIMERALLLPAYGTFQPVGFRRSVDGLRFAQGNWQILFYDATKR